MSVPIIRTVRERIVFFSQGAAKNLHSLTLERIDLCRRNFAAENGEQDFATLSPLLSAPI